MQRIVRAALRRWGFDLIRFTADRSRDRRTQLRLRHLGITTVLDVGANAGQYGLSLRELGFQGLLISFEPQPAAHTTLVKNARRDPQWQVAEPLALGEDEGTATLHVSANSVSSSLLPVAQNHLLATPESRTVTSIEVPLTTLDAWCRAHLPMSGPIWLKVDTQGYEGPILRGAVQTLQRVAGLQLEVALVPIYEGQEVLETLRPFLASLNYRLVALEPTYTDPRTGEILAYDGVWVNAGFQV